MFFEYLVCAFGKRGVILVILKLYSGFIFYVARGERGMKSVLEKILKISGFFCVWLDISNGFGESFF